MSRTTNKDLGNAIVRLEGRMDIQEKNLNELKAEVAPLHHTMLQVSGGVTLIKWMLSGAGALVTIIELYRVFRGH